MNNKVTPNSASPEFEHQPYKKHQGYTYRKLKQKRAVSYDQEYDFLIDKQITRETLINATELAKKWEVPVHDVLISMGWLTHANYTRALAEHTGLKYIQNLHASQLSLSNIPEKIQQSYKTGLFQGEAFRGKTIEDTVILSSHSPSKPSSLKKVVKKLGVASGKVYLASQHQLRYAISSLRGSLLSKEAIYGLENKHPGCSARKGLTKSQIFFLLLVCSIFSFISFVSTKAIFWIMSVLLSIMFFFVVWVRIAACIQTLRRPYKLNIRNFETAYWRQAASGLSSDATLPVYTILVPIFREKAVLETLIQALLRLDYPSAKLDIKLIFEECDKETLEYAKYLRIPEHIECIVVPDSKPRTKPKALNYAMQFARGDYVVIYDAEDQPEPDQLRKAVTAFRLAPENVACMQARLSFYNAHENWLTKQFAIEYASLFNGLLPTLQSLDLPIPLGGTSNHFRMSVLRKIGVWDAFNVTEDADIGMRLYRNGYTCRVLNSITHEEATCSLKAWIPQRTRWLKGWIQTYAVHMRNPIKLYRQLGNRGFIGFQTMIGGFIASALIHPIFLSYLIGMVLIKAFTFQSMTFSINLEIFSLISFFNLAFGYSSAMCLGAIIVRQSRMRRVTWSLLTMPFYWCFISLAAYRALFQFFRAPFLWEKTEHGVTKVKRKS